MIKEIVVNEPFHATDGTFVEPGEFTAGDLVNDSTGKEVQLFKRKGYNQTFKLSAEDLAEHQNKIKEIHY